MYCLMKEPGKLVSIWQIRARVRITKLDIQMLHNESWEPVVWGVKGKDHESTGVGLCTVVSAGFF